MSNKNKDKKPQFCYVFFPRPNSFVIITANRVIHCNTDTPEEMHHWIGLLQKSKGDSRVDGQEFIVRGKRILILDLIYLNKIR